MNKITGIYLIAVMASFMSCSGRTGKTGDRNNMSDTGKADIEFREYEHLFGKVKEGEKVGYVFIFTNTGTADLVIQAATTTCGCTVPEYDRKPVQPGQTGKLEVIFDTSGRSGIQSKIITVRSNASNPVVMLKITAEVINDN